MFFFVVSGCVAQPVPTRNNNIFKVVDDIAWSNKINPNETKPSKEPRIIVVGYCLKRCDPNPMIKLETPSPIQTNDA